MYQIFNTYTATRGLIEFGRWRVLREQLQQSLQRAVDYYRTSRTWIDSKHPLVSLLNSVNVPLSLETRVYNDRVSDLALELGRMFKFTSPVSKGTMREPSMFYGVGVAEAVLVTVEDYDVNRMDQNWRTATPIRVLRHPRTDLGLALLNGQGDTAETGIAVISINLPMLATQYRCWKLTEGRLEDGEYESIQTFLSNYPLTNMLASHYDLAFFNRMVCLFKGRTPAEPAGRTPFWQLDLSPKVDDILAKELVTLQNRRISFDDILTQIPCITAECLGDLFRIPAQGLYTRQVIWLYALFRLPLLAFLVQQNARNANPRNTYYLKEIRRFFIASSNDREIVSMLPYKYQNPVSEEIRFGILPFLETYPEMFGSPA